MYDTRNFNFKLERKPLMCAFFYTEYLLCAMFTESLNCASDLICFHNTGHSPMVVFFLAFLTLTRNPNSLPAAPPWPAARSLSSVLVTLV